MPLDLPSLLPSARGDEVALVLRCNCHFALDLLSSSDLQVQEALKAAFGDHSHQAASLREDTVTEVVLRLLLRKPQPELLASAGKVLAAWQRDGYDGFAMVQSRQWVDLQPTSRPPILEEVNCSLKRLRSYRASLPGERQLLVAVTSDSSSHARRLTEALASSGDVKTNSVYVDNTHSASRFLKSFTHSQALVDWYLLGEADFAICTGSTYCISARARKGFGNDGTFPFSSKRLTYRHGGRACSGDEYLVGWRGLDTLTDPTSGRVWW
eukprot:TRINITY_DN82686_c0_g1_i1.p1 TRINITY_DN82686_c0_g1~~TRINITY_DN82686_c0_g1_i1.p1  ORF type:complete len:268 (-),score=45.50 TRINITY_DN82686_c0_g1_i1:271-1074(-)